MEFNKINITKDDELKSNEYSNEYELKSDTLDHLYKTQIIELRDSILKSAEHTNDIEICREWLKVFSQTSKAEKVARNCLCTLMQQQIKECGHLHEPFINLQNCDRDLESILLELDNQLSDKISSRSFLNASINSFTSHCLNDIENNFDNLKEQNRNTLLKECQHIELRTETTKLTCELQSLRLQLTETQMENVKLKEIAEKCRLEKEAFGKIIDGIKNSILKCIGEKLLDMDQCGLVKTQFKFLQIILAQFSDDKEYMGILSKYDLDLQHVLQNMFKYEFDKQKRLMARHICRKFVKSNLKLRKKYEHRLTLQAQAHKLQLKLAKLNCFSILRQIFINYHNEFGKADGIS